MRIESVEPVDVDVEWAEHLNDVAAELASLREVAERAGWNPGNWVTGGDEPLPDWAV